MAREEEDRRQLGAVFAADPTVRLLASVGLDDLEAIACNGVPHLIVGFADSHADCEQFRRVADRWAESVSLLFVTDPAELSDRGEINEVCTRERLAREDAMPELLSGIRRRFHPASISRAEARQRDEIALERLSEREREVLALTAQGRSMKQIAGDLHRSYATVASHRDSIRRKLAMHDIATLTRFAIRTGLVQA